MRLGTRLSFRFAVRTLVTEWLDRRCPVCSIEAGDPVCAGCERDFFAPCDRCFQCALPIAASGSRCGKCLSDPPHFDSTVALADYAPPLDGMIAALKFSARLDLSNLFGRMLARHARVPAGALIAAVPLSGPRLAERGFNQALHIAGALCRHTGNPLSPRLLRRVRASAPQQSLPLAARRRNVRGAFAVDGDVVGQTVIVIDDVMTSGSTLDEIAKTLKAAGAARVDAIVVARTA